MHTRTLSNNNGFVIFAIALLVPILDYSATAEIRTIDFETIPRNGTPVDSFANFFPGLSLTSGNPWLPSEVNNSFFENLHNRALSTLAAVPPTVSCDLPVRDVTIDLGSGTKQFAVMIGITGYLTRNPIFFESFVTHLVSGGGDDMRTRTFGVIDRIVVNRNGGLTGLTLDNLSFTVAPEPSTSMLPTIALVAIALHRRRVDRHIRQRIANGRLLVLTIALLAAPICPNSAFGQQSFFQGMGYLPDGLFSPALMSADGTVVAGSTIANVVPGSSKQYRWTRQTGLVELNPLPGYLQVGLLSISNDGSSIGGVASSNDKWEQDIVRWTNSSDPISLVTLNAASYSPGRSTIVSYISPDGQIAFGNFGDQDNRRTFRWKLDTGVQVLPTTVGGKTARFIEITGGAADGAIAIGRANGLSFGNNETVRWVNTRGGGEYQVIGTIGPGVTSNIPGAATPDGSHVLINDFTGTKNLWSAGVGITSLVGGEAYAISDNGQVLGGYTGPLGQERTARWTKATGWQQLDPLSDGAEPRSITMSSDGAIMIGLTTGGTNGGPYIWDVAHGSRYIRDVLSLEHGLAESLVGWKLEAVSLFSNDGRTIYGSGINPAGQKEAWIAFLGTPVPEPSTLLLAATATAPLAFRRRAIQHRRRPRTANGLIAALTIAVVPTLICSQGAQAQQAFFMGLGDLPGGDFYSLVSDISGDGSVVVGTSHAAEPQGFRWTRTSGMFGLDGTVSADLISTDGSTIVGYTSPAFFFRWRQSTGLVPLTRDNIFSSSNTLTGLSTDGSKIADWNKVWTEASGWVTGPNSGMRIAGMSDDGQIFTGWNGQIHPANFDAYVWSPRGMTEFGPPFPNGKHIRDPYRISGDGNVVLGDGLRWERGVGLKEIAEFGGCANALSEDGSVMAGGTCIWSKSRGVEQLTDVLTGLGLSSEFSSWSSLRITALSANGLTVGGFGTNPAGFTEGWVAHLGTPVPEPSMLFMAAQVLVSFGWHRCRGRNGESHGLRNICNRVCKIIGPTGMRD